MPPKLTTSQWIKNCIKVWDNQYTYENVNYIDSRTYVYITCPIHGDFKRRPVDFLTNKIGCPLCSKENKNKSQTKSLEQFISEANRIHNNKYNYSKTNYINGTTKITITCPIHGDFKQTPNNHLRGNQCPSCSKHNSLKSSYYNTEQFISEANRIHNNKYDYSKTIYISDNEPVMITCPIHGDFEQKPYNHLHSKIGCPECIKNNLKEKNTKTTEQFVSEANRIHNNKYDYSKTKYIHSEQSVLITCQIHGDFHIQASSHLKGSGCVKCSNNSKSDTTESFIEKAKQLHQLNNEPIYLYDKVDYKSSHEKVIITCKIHGDFEQRPNNHLIRQGCPKCGYNISVSKGEQELFDFINNLMKDE